MTGIINVGASTAHYHFTCMKWQMVRPRLEGAPPPKDRQGGSGFDGPSLPPSAGYDSVKCDWCTVIESYWYCCHISWSMLHEAPCVMTQLHE